MGVIGQDGHDNKVRRMEASTAPVIVVVVHNGVFTKKLEELKRKGSKIG